MADLFDSRSDFEEDMEAEAEVLRHDRDFPNVGKCKACLEPDRSLDENGICDRCKPSQPESYAALLDVLNIKPTGEPGNA